MSFGKAQILQPHEERKPAVWFLPAAWDTAPGDEDSDWLLFTEVT